MIRKIILALLTTVSVAVVVLWCWGLKSDPSTRIRRDTLTGVSLAVSDGMVYCNWWKTYPAEVRQKETWIVDHQESDFPWMIVKCVIRYSPVRDPAYDYRGLRIVWFCYPHKRLWIPLAMFSAYPSVAFIRGPLRRYRRRKRGLCVRCGYDLTGNVSGACSECGEGT